MALDEATKHAEVDVVFAKSFYAGSGHASGRLSGEILGVIAASDPEISALAVAALRGNVARYGMALAPDDMADLCRSYTGQSDAGSRETARTILALLPKRVRPALPPPVDAASFRPTR